jgi:DNA-binding transcriptional regulator YiaG
MRKMKNNLDKYESEIEIAAQKSGVKSTGEELSKYVNAARATIKKRAFDLKKIREKELGLSQRELAELLGVSKRTLQRWDMGRSEMPRPVQLWMQLLKEKPFIKKWLKKQTLALN